MFYTADTGCLSLKYWQEPDNYAPLIEKDQKDVLSLFVHSVEHYIFYDGESDMEKAVWNNGDFGCRIMGSVTQAELEDIIKSIYRV